MSYRSELGAEITEERLTAYFQEKGISENSSVGERERSAFREMQKEAFEEQDPEIREFMWATLCFYCDEASMLFTYIYENRWAEAVAEQRHRKAECKPKDLSVDLEDLMSRCCDASGYTKHHEGPRKLLTVPGYHDGTQEIRNDVRSVPGDLLRRSFYKFGSHKFHVGSAIHEILSHIECRYGLDFEQLERNRAASCSKENN
ncbi:MAG: hypothetical protein LCH56_16750 [Proteobacteria bacterium]|nr:hypothetical protein [Pseudomonadota bacterium]